MNPYSRRSQPQEQSDRSSTSEAQIPRGIAAPFDHMAATVLQPILPPPPHHPHFVGDRPTLPPLAQLTGPHGTGRPPLLIPGTRHGPPAPVRAQELPAASSLLSQSSPSTGSYGPQQIQVVRIATNDSPQGLDVYGLASDSRGPRHGTKRPFEQMSHSSPNAPQNFSIQQQAQQFENEEEQRLRAATTTFSVDKRGSVGSAGTNPESASSIHSAFGRTHMFPQGTRPQLPTSSVNTGRYSLYLRQQPRAARAGPDGKDRRAIDPPPVLQLLLEDFNPDSEEDMADMKNHFWVVHTKLIPAQSLQEEAGASSGAQEANRSQEVPRLLLGTTVSSPFFCADDPDPGTAPKISARKDRSSSPTSRFITSSSNRERAALGSNVDPSTRPATFFIFADLSIRKAGEYKLEFRLMKMDPATLQPGSIVPMIASVTSQQFRVVNAKDFDQVQPSTSLIRGLLARGAGFPLKLKKGVREGQRRPNVRSGSGDDDDDDDDEEEEEEEEEEEGEDNEDENEEER